MPASTSRSVCVGGDGMAMGRIIPHTPCVWRAPLGGGRPPTQTGESGDSQGESILRRMRFCHATPDNMSFATPMMMVMW